MDSKYYKEIGKFVKTAQKSADATLTDKNLLYVVKVAADVASKTGADFDMLLCEGLRGMRKAEEKYNPELNDSFTKFAAMHVRGYMMNGINRESNLIHVPANHMPGFKKGQERTEESKLEFVYIDQSDYDTLDDTEDSNMVDRTDVLDILEKGLNQLDINGRIAMEMKLHMGKYSETVPNPDSTRVIFKYNNTIEDIANELEVPVTIANKIYKDAKNKLSKYCQSASI